MVQGQAGGQAMGERTGVGSAAEASGAAEAAQRRRALYRKLKPGPGRTPGQVAANQRARLSGALIELVAVRGYEGITVRELSRLAGVSTKTFYDCFANVEECFVTTYALIIRDALSVPGDLPADPGERLRARLERFFASLGKDPKAARLVLVDAAMAAPALNARTRRVDRALERMISEELAPTTAGPPLARTLVQGAAAAAMQLARSRLLSASAAPAAAAAGEFTDWLASLRGADLDGLSVLGGPLPRMADADRAPPPSVIGEDRHFLIQAVGTLVVRDGYEKLTAPAICRAAGISRRTFDESFDSVADCFLAAVEAKVAAVLGRAEAQAADAESWDRGVVRAVAIICTQLRHDPALANLVSVDVFTAGLPGLELRERVLARWARRLRRTAPRASRPGELAAEASVAAAAAIGAPGRRTRLDQTARSAAFVVLAPAVGSARAMELIGAELGAQGWRVE
jgi:AcrR family transcriptional regulator